MTETKDRIDKPYFTPPSGDFSAMEQGWREAVGMTKQDILKRDNVWEGTQTFENDSYFTGESFFYDSTYNYEYAQFFGGVSVTGDFTANEESLFVGETWFEDNIYLDNDKFLKGYPTYSDAVNLVGMNSGNDALFGPTDGIVDDTYLRAKNSIIFNTGGNTERWEIDTSGNLLPLSTGYLGTGANPLNGSIMGNDKYHYGRDTGGSNRKLIGLNSNNDLTVGQTSGIDDVFISAPDAIYLQSGASTKWTSSSAGHFFPAGNNTQNIGGSSDRVANLYVQDLELDDSCYIRSSGTNNLDINVGASGVGGTMTIKHGSGQRMQLQNSNIEFSSAYASAANPSSTSSNCVRVKIAGVSTQYYLRLYY